MDHIQCEEEHYRNTSSTYLAARTPESKRVATRIPGGDGPRPRSVEEVNDHGSNHVRTRRGGGVCRRHRRYGGGSPHARARERRPDQAAMAARRDYFALPPGLEAPWRRG